MSVGREDRLLFIQDDVSGRRFLCDTGAQRTVVPASRVDILTGGQAPPPLEAANGTPIRTFGTRCLELSFMGQCFSWDFVTAKIAIRLLVVDFQCAYGLLVDVKGHRLMNAVTFSSYPCTLSGAGSTGLTSMLTADEFLQLLAKFPDLTQPTFSSSTVRHGVEHHLSTTGPPVHARVRRLDPAKLTIAKAEFENMEHLGIIRRSNSPWASPLHIAPKPGGGWRPCGNYRRLNDATVPDRYPVPHIQDFSAHLSDSVVFSKVDLVRGYH